MRRRVFLGVLVAALASLTPPAFADTEIFSVGSVGDAADVAADNVCDADAGAPVECTFRAAIMEANDSDPITDVDSIVFPTSPFNGEIADTIDVGASGLPAITDPLNVTASCGLVDKPCAGIDSPPPGPAVITVSSPDVQIANISVTNGNTGISVVGGAPLTGFKLFGTWVGVKLDGTAGANATGVVLDPNVSGAQVGSTAGNKNVIANSSNTGVAIIGGDDNTIQSSLFGVLADGATQAANGQNIAIAGNSTGPVQATGNVIGGALSPAEAATPACDGTCNVISGAAPGDGINLSGPIAGEIPAKDTVIRNNHIGLDETGTAALENANDGVKTGDFTGTGTLIQGNAITGGVSAVEAGTAQDGAIEVDGNRIGTNSAGTATLDQPTYGIVTSPAPSGATVTGNRISVSFLAISHSGDGGIITDNVIGLGVNGEELTGAPIRLQGGTAEGSVVDSNVVANAFFSGIDIDGSDNNTITGNKLGVGAGNANGRGITINPFFAQRSTGNVIGGDTAGDENVISNSLFEAIKISDDEQDDNQVLRNRGSGDGGYFLDLTPPDGIGNDVNGPNGGILAPTVKSARRGADRVKGTGVPGTTVRVYRAHGFSDDQPNGLLKFLGEKTVGAGGTWKLNPAGKLKKGWLVSANQTSSSDGSSEFARAKEVKP
jgi:parallel beta-helix repeat protein